MRILIACEFSGRVREEFLKRGHKAISCDLQPTQIPSEHHYEGDITDILYLRWDMIIAFPPCTHLANSGNRWKAQKKLDGRYQQGVDFFMLFANHPCEKICIENPVGAMSTEWKKPTQIIQPWQFGDSYQKTTYLWLKGLPTLRPNNIVDKGEFVIHGGRRMPKWYSHREFDRSLTFPGIAKAMGETWG